MPSSDQLGEIVEIGHCKNSMFLGVGGGDGDDDTHQKNRKEKIVAAVMVYRSRQFYF